MCLGLQAHPFCILFPRFRRPLLVALDQNPYIHCPSDKKKKQAQSDCAVDVDTFTRRGGERRREAGRGGRGGGGGGGGDTTLQRLHRITGVFCNNKNTPLFCVTRHCTALGSEQKQKKYSAILSDTENSRVFFVFVFAKYITIHCTRQQAKRGAEATSFFGTRQGTMNKRMNKRQKQDKKGVGEGGRRRHAARGRNKWDKQPAPGARQWGCVHAGTCFPPTLTNTSLVLLLTECFDYIQP